MSPPAEGRHRDRQKHERVLECAAKMQQGGLAGRAEQTHAVNAASARPAGMPKTCGVTWPELSRTRSAEKPSSPDSRIAMGAPSGAP